MKLTYFLLIMSLSFLRLFLNTIFMPWIYVHIYIASFSFCSRAALLHECYSQHRTTFCMRSRWLWQYDTCSYITLSCICISLYCIMFAADCNSQVICLLTGVSSVEAERKMFHFKEIIKCDEWNENRVCSTFVQNICTNYENSKNMRKTS